MDSNESDILKLRLVEEATEEDRELAKDTGAGFRRHFRVNSNRCLSKVSARIEGHCYEVINLSMAGAGLRIRDPAEFPYRHDPLSITLAIGKKILELQGRFMHLSSHESGGYICGIGFYDPPPASSKVLTKLLAKNRHKEKRKH